MQWGRFILIIRGENLQFYLNFALFSRLGGGVKLDHYIFRVSQTKRRPKKTKKKSTKLSEGEKKEKGLHQNLKSFRPRNPVQIKRKSPKTIQRSDADHSQIIRGDAVILLGDISPEDLAPLLACKLYNNN